MAESEDDMPLNLQLAAADVLRTPRKVLRRRDDDFSYVCPGPGLRPHSHCSVLTDTQTRFGYLEIIYQNSSSVVVWEPAPVSS